MLTVFSVSGLVALGVAGGVVAPITAPLAAASIAKGIIIKKGEHFILLEKCCLFKKIVLLIIEVLGFLLHSVLNKDLLKLMPNLKNLNRVAQPP